MDLCKSGREAHAKAGGTVTLYMCRRKAPSYEATFLMRWRRFRVIGTPVLSLARHFESEMLAESFLRFWKQIDGDGGAEFDLREVKATTGKIKIVGYESRKIWGKQGRW